MKPHRGLHFRNSLTTKHTKYTKGNQIKRIGGDAGNASDSFDLVFVFFSCVSCVSWLALLHAQPVATKFVVWGTHFQLELLAVPSRGKYRVTD
jgi:hypothetical protein